MEIIKRPDYESAIQEHMKCYAKRLSGWKIAKTVCVVNGLAGSGKTTFLLNRFNSNGTFYFSFAGLIENIAEKVFTDYVMEKTNSTVLNWENGITAVSKKYKFIIFDDVSVVLSSERFRKAFYNYMITDINNRPFVILITQMTDSIKGLSDSYYDISFDYFSIPEVMKLYPMLSKFDILGLCAVSGGIPKIMNEYDEQKSFEDNLRNMLELSSSFCNFMPELLLRYFRKPESYHYILYAIANGNHSVSEIGKFTGYAYNKCDNYLSALVSCGIVEAEKVLSKRKAEKTAYRLANNYFRLWYLYVYMNHTEIQLGNGELINGIIRNIINKEIHNFHLEKAFLTANERMNHDLWTTFRLSDRVEYTPKTIRKGDFSYTFDAIARNGYKAAFVKVFANPFENCKKDELDKIRRAVDIANKYYDNRIYIFSKRRFSDYAVAEAAKDYSIKLVEIDRLRF